MSHHQEPREPMTSNVQQQSQYGGGQQQQPQQMSQGQQQPQQMTQGQQQQSQQMSQGMDFEDTLTGDMRLALHDTVQAVTICNWCADECLGDPQMEECARLCRDVADLAVLNIQFISRDSIFGVDVAEAFAYAAEECAQECAQHHQGHCQKCASVLRRAVDSTWAMLDSFEHIPQGGQQHQQSQIQQY